jgi:two-component system, cell cycle sensor histidine kinase and response regulator CckA
MVDTLGIILYVSGLAAVGVALLLVYWCLRIISSKSSRAEYRPRRGEDVSRALLNTPSESLLLLDKGGIILDMNRAAAERFGKQVQELVGSCIYDVYPLETREAERQGVEEVLRSGLPHVFQDEVSGRHYDVAIRPIFAKNRVVEGVTVSARDTTEQKQLETQLRQAHKMEAIGQLAGGVAHDFNNLLQAILGYGEIALEGTSADNPVHDAIGQMCGAGERAKTLVSQLLAFSRRQMLDMKDLDLNAAVADLMKMIRRVIGEHIILNFISGPDIGTIRGDNSQITQILMNLCVNARDAMPDGGRISIETMNAILDDAYCCTHSWAQPGNYAVLSVSDTGCGMDEQTVKRAFEPFFTTKGVGEGTGLGLSTVYGIVRQHEGLVHIYSEIGKGTNLKIYLPVVERSDEAVDATTRKAIPGGTETILVAEDDELVRRLALSALKRAGYTVLTACDGEEAFAAFSKHADQIDLALIDVVMPKLGGHAVFERVREQAPSIRVLFCSGYGAGGPHTDFIVDERLALLQKPYQRNDLLRAVRDVLDAP